jgi:hypothetical protein
VRELRLRAQAPGLRDRLVHPVRRPVTLVERC